MKPWLFVGAKVTQIVRRVPNISGRSVSGCNQTEYGKVYTIRAVVDYGSEIALLFEEVHNELVLWRGEWVEPAGLADWYGPVSTIDTTKTVEALKQMMRDHVANASGGAGIRKVRA